MFKQKYRDKNNNFWSQIKKAPKNLEKELYKKCQENQWLRNDANSLTDPLLDFNYNLSFVRALSIEALRCYFDWGNWGLRTGIIYKNLAFINQKNGGDEWWTLRRISKNKFEVIDPSISFANMISAGCFHDYINGLCKNTQRNKRRLFHVYKR